MQHSAELLRCLTDCDLAGARRLWASVRPNMPQPKTDEEAEVILHHARTQLMALPLRARAYSHCWLIERSLPSGLPDELRPSAERMYPRVVEAVGISVKSSEIMKPIALRVRTAMTNAVMEAYADKKTDPVYVKARMLEARELEYEKLVS